MKSFKHFFAITKETPTKKNTKRLSIFNRNHSKGHVWATLLYSDFSVICHFFHFWAYTIFDKRLSHVSWKSSNHIVFHLIKLRSQLFVRKTAIFQLLLILCQEIAKYNIRMEKFQNWYGYGTFDTEIMQLHCMVSRTQHHFI